MKRITYISRFAHPFSTQEIDRLRQLAERNNQRYGITGVLVCAGGVFFQIIEGEKDNIDRLFANIRQDSRHTDVLCLKTEHGVRERAFPEWSMQTLNLDETTDALMRPIRSLLQVLSQSHGILEKYTQPTVLKFLNQGANPLEIKPRRLERVILFCDIVAFSQFAAVLDVEEVLAVVNQYLSICTDLISARGGEATKFMGDCVMAYFPRESVDAALRAGLEILSSLENQRHEAPPGDPLGLVRSGVGLAFGEVIEGNIGSRVKTDYTVLGDAVNQAAYLQALTRTLPRSLAFSQGVKDIASPDWKLMNLGEYSLKAGLAPSPVFSIDNPLTAQSADAAQTVAWVKNGLRKRAQFRSAK